MTQPGMGAMIHILTGGSEHDPNEFYGRKIVSAQLDKTCDPERVRVSFEDGVNISIWDNGQSCCESRYITCDDDFSRIVGGNLLSIETKPAPDVEDEYEVHEQVFIDIVSSEGTVTFTTHNEHNGYYGGFGLTITVDQPSEPE